MPQLDPSHFAPQLFWLVVSFIMLYLLMSRFALPRVGHILQERAGRVAGDLAAAAKLRQETDQAIADYEKALAEARARAQAIARQAREEIGADITRQRAEIDQQISAKTADAEKRITTLKESAIGHIGEIATETAEAIVARLLGKRVERAELQGAVNEVLGK